MKNLASTLTVALIASTSAPAHDKEEHCNHVAAQAATPEETAAGVLSRGEKLKGLPKLTLASLLSAPAAHAGKSIAVEAKVRRACQKAGCWMELANDEKGPGVRVTFMKGGFAVPLDSAGKLATVEGEVKVAELSDEKAKHLAAEGAIVPRGKDGKAREVQLVATGLTLR